MMAKAPTRPAVAPAPPPEAEPAEAAPVRQETAGVPVFALLLMTVLALAMGGAFGTLIYPAPPPEKQHIQPPPDRAGRPGFILVPLPPVTTNLAGGSRVWVRLEATLVMEEGLGDKTLPLANKIAEDIVAYLRTVTPEQLEGASGFQHLREDLNDRIRIRSEGKVSDILIQTMIIE
jgi:flagellar FliL protein